MKNYSTFPINVKEAPICCLAETSVQREFGVRAASR
jgi:hypothetical protein